MNASDNAWVLASSALVLLMTPGLALFYGGMTRSKNVLSTMMHSFFLIGLASIVWLFWTYSLSFGPDAFGGFIGGLQHFALNGVGSAVREGTTIPHTTFMIFQCMFAVITPALISGAFAERMKFSTFVVFMLVWMTVVYAPVCHWVWGPGGWLQPGGVFGKDVGALDFAGGTVVHINSAAAALACALMLGKRKGYGTVPMPPHNLTLTLLGAGLLWFGWFGFNAGSALKADGAASMAFVVTHMATCAAALSWVFAEWVLKGKPTTLGFASGAVAGLVAITPASGFVGPVSSVILGAVAGVVCYMGCLVKSRLGYDDALDVVGVHGVGGTWGAIATGLFAAKEIGGTNGVFFGNAAQLMPQVVAVLATIAYSFIVSIIILAVIKASMCLRVTDEEESMGMDTTVHGEAAYNL